MCWQCYNIRIKHVFHALKFARSRGRCWKPRPKAENFNSYRGTWQTLINWKTMFHSFYCIISTKYSVTFAKDVAPYFVNGVVVQMICKSINKKEICLPLYAIISMQNKPNTFLGHPTVLDCRKLFSSLRFTLSWHLEICTNNIALTSVSRPDDVRILR